MFSISALATLIDLFQADFSSSLQIIGLLTTALITVYAIILASYSVAFTSARVIAVAILMLAILLWVWTQHGPATVRFRLANSQFQGVVESIRDNNELETPLNTAPMWIGTYYVQKVTQTENDEICFWTVLRRNGNSGIVYSPNGPPQQNTFTEIQLGPDWYLISID